MIKEIVVWSKWLRIIHGVFIVSFVALILSGWLLNNSVKGYESSMVVHQVASSFIGFFLVFRLLLLFFGSQAENIKSFFNQADKRQQSRSLLAFYFSLGKLPLPNWHSKSALWAIVYLFMFVLIALALITGILANYQDMWLGWVVLDVHLQLTQLLMWVVVLHVISAVLHDVKSSHANISAIISGNRYFKVDDKKPSNVQVKFK